MSDELDGLAKDLRRIEADIDQRVGQARSIKSEGALAMQDIAQSEAKVVSLEEAIGVLNTFADSRQAELQEKIEKLVTYGLRTIFDQGMSFHILMAQRGKLTATEFVVRSQVGDEVIETPIMDARGGGVAAVAGFLLRLILLMLRKDSAPILFLDETFAQLSTEYEPRLAEFLKELADKTKVQLVLVTHSSAYDESADRVYRMKLKDGLTQVEQLV